MKICFNVIFLHHSLLYSIQAAPPVNGADILLLTVFREIKLSVFIYPDDSANMSHSCLASLFKYKIILMTAESLFSDFYLLMRPRILESEPSIRMKSDHIRAGGWGEALFFLPVCFEII